MTGTLPLEMTGFDREYLPPRSLRGGVTDPVSAWDLFWLEQQEITADWARTTLDSLVASVTAEATDALGCTDCHDTGFYGIAAAGDPDLLVGLLRRINDNQQEILLADGGWELWTGQDQVEILDLDLAGDLAAAITGGACGLLRRYYWPRAFLAPAAVVAAVACRDVLSADRPDTPQAEWVNYAVVDDVDQGAVLDLVHLRASAGAEVLERWEDGAWIPDPDLLGNPDLPLVELTAQQTTDVQAQLAAALLADAPLTVSPNPKAEKLRRYWSTGKGAAKIRWMTPGDARRCHAHLEKYMPGRAWAYCNNLHKRNNGFWTGDRRNRGGRGRIGSADIYSPTLIQVTGSAHSRPVGTVHHIFRVGDVMTFVAAEASAGPATAQILASGDKFHVRGIDVTPVVTETVAGTSRVEVMQDVIQLAVTGNRSHIDQPRGSVSEAVAESPGAVAVAVPMERPSPPPATVGQDVVVRLKTAHDEIRRAIFHEPLVVAHAHSALEASGTTVPVIDATSHGFHCTHSRCGWVDREPRSSPEEALLSSIRTGHWAGVSERRTTDMPQAMLMDGIYTEGEDENAGILATLTAGGFPVAPPDDWYNNPKFSGPTPMVVEDSGRVYGHIATFNVTHIGMAGAVRAPRSASNYAYFLTGSLKTAAGREVNVGQLTLAGGHAPMGANAADAVKHYDDTNSAVCDVTAGEDRYGIWVAGSLRPDITEAQVRAFRASPISGDWRPINGNLELVAACAVNVPGFMNVRAQAAMAAGAMVALVAAGAQELWELKTANMGTGAVLTRLASLETRLVALEAPTSPADSEDDIEAAGKMPAKMLKAAKTKKGDMENAADMDAEEAAEEMPDKEDGKDKAADEKEIKKKAVKAAGETDIVAPVLDQAALTRLASARAAIADDRRDAVRARVAAGKIPPQFLKNAKKKQADAEGADDNDADETAEAKKKTPMKASTTPAVPVLVPSNRK